MSERIDPPVIAGYTYLRELGSGGNATVFQYRDDDLSRPVAVKVLHGSAGADPVPGGLDEASMMARLGKNPGVVQVYRIGRTQAGDRFIVMEFCEGPDLAQLAAGGIYDIRAAVAIGQSLAETVQAAHSAGIVHRDIKPANVLTDEGRPRLADFGIAGRVATLVTGEVPLSLPWAAPEVARLSTAQSGSAADIDWRRADIYSIGATLWHLLAGHSPFHVPGDKSWDRMRDRILNNPVPKLKRTGVPPALEQLLGRMLAKNPRQRPETAADVAKTLADLAAHWPQDELAKTFVPRRTPEDLAPGTGLPLSDPGPTLIPQAPPAPASHPVVRRTPWTWIAAGVIVSAAAAGIWFAQGTGDAGKPSAYASDAAPPTQEVVPGGDLPPGVPAITAIRVDAKTVRFTWTYSAALDNDTFTWRTPDGSKSGTVDKPVLDLADPAGRTLCVQIKVVRADGAHAAVDWSPQGCGK